MTVNTYSVRLHAQRLAEATTRARTLTHSLRDAIQRANAYKNPDLTDQALQRARADMTRDFRAAGGNDLAKLREELETSRGYLAEAAREAASVASDPAALIRAEQKWTQVRVMLDAGIDLRKILSTADEDTARAVAEFGPSWAKAKDYRPPHLQDEVNATIYGAEAFAVDGWVQEAAYRRLAEATTDADLSELLTVAAQSDAHLAPATPYLDATQSIVTNGSADMLGAAVASQIAGATAEPAAV